jgi:hypothetical protein
MAEFNIDKCMECTHAEYDCGNYDGYGYCKITLRCSCYPDCIDDEYDEEYEE